MSDLTCGFLPRRKLPVGACARHPLEMDRHAPMASTARRPALLWPVGRGNPARGHCAVRRQQPSVLQACYFQHRVVTQALLHGR